MKKSILSMSVAVALGGLGFAGAASAIVVYDNTGATGTQLAQHPAGTGHIMVVPYYSAQGSNATLITIVNTDVTNGKAVKVRFRGATNSDDVLDFTLLMSPGDVWSGQVAKGPNGFAQLSHSSDETTCTLPDASAWPANFSALRLPTSVSGDNLASLTREGYVEILNMADIRPDTASNSVFTAIKHVNGKAPCTSAVLNQLVTTEVLNAAQAGATPYDLVLPTGGLMGSWAVLNQAQTVAFSGADTAMIVTDANGVGTNGTAASQTAALAFFPQVSATYGTVPTGSPAAPGIAQVTADPLLVGGLNDSPTGAAIAAPVIPLWYDLPDLSTPILQPVTTPQVHADALTMTMVKTNVQNEWMSVSGAVPFATDWVVSQPTRRYHVAMNYGLGHRIFSAGSTFTGYNNASLTTGGAYGPLVCMTFGLGAFNREEGSNAMGASFSPGTNTDTCGEVFTLQFGGNSVLAAAVTANPVGNIVAPLGGAGWAQLNAVTGQTLAGATLGLPMLGFSATQYTNQLTGMNYSYTFPHRWIMTP